MQPLNVCVCVFMCAHVCLHACMHVCSVSMPVCVCVHAHVCTFVPACVYEPVCVNMYMVMFKQTLCLLVPHYDIVTISFYWIMIELLRNFNW